MHFHDLASDDHHVFFEGRRLTKVPRVKFEYLFGHYFAIDGELYFKDRPCKSVSKKMIFNKDNCKWLNPFNDEYLIHDSGKVIFNRRPLNNKVDGHTFMPINSFYAKDHKQIYICFDTVREIKCADYDSFEVIAKRRAKDKNREYDACEYLEKNYGVLL